MTPGARDSLSLEHGVGNRLFGRFLDGLFREDVAQFTFASALVVFGVLDVTERAGCLAHLEVVVLGQMLVTGSAAEFHALDGCFDGGMTRSPL